MNIKNIVAASVSALALCSGAASAGVVQFAITGTYTQGNGSPDLPTTTVALGPVATVTVDPGSSGDHLNFSADGAASFSTIAPRVDGYQFLQSYAAGQTINSASFGSFVSDFEYDVVLSNNQTAGAWNASHHGYLGFKSAAGNFGYIEYDYIRANQLSTITFLSGAYENVANAGITTPAAVNVPEPASAALLGLGLLGFAASRRKSK